MNLDYFYTGKLFSAKKQIINAKKVLMFLFFKTYSDEYEYDLYERIATEAKNRNRLQKLVDMDIKKKDKESLNVKKVKTNTAVEKKNGRIQTSS